MNLALGIVCIWLGAAFVWVAASGVSEGARGFSGIWSKVLSGLAGDGG